MSVLIPLLSYSCIGAEEDPFDKGRRLFNQGAFKEAREAFTECFEEEIQTDQARWYLAGMTPEKLKRLKRGKIEKLVQDSSRDETLGLIEAQLHLLKVHPITNEQTGLKYIQSKVGTNGYAAYIMGQYHGGAFGGPENRRMAEVFYGLSDGLGFRAASEVLQELRREADREGPIGMGKDSDDGRTVRDIPEVDLDDLRSTISSNSSVIKGFEGGAKGRGDDGLSALEGMSDIENVLRGEEKTPASSSPSRLQETRKSGEEEEEKKAANDTLLNPKYESLLKHHKDYAAALRGDAWAQCTIGYSFVTGINGLPKDDAEAVTWFRKAADQGYAAAQVNLGAMYQDGRGVEQDDSEAVTWVRKAAAQGDAIAQNNLGAMYVESRGVEKDDAEAVTWYKKAAAQGYAIAQYNLGVMYKTGRGVEQDDAEAVTWYRKAADQGYAGAQYAIGAMYAESRGVEKDDAEAVTWFRKAADQGHAQAQNNLGAMYDQGRGVAQDDVEAVTWYKKAAAQGDAPAQYNLGRMYATGRGVEKDDAEAVTWYKKAAAQGQENAQAAMKRLGLSW